MNGSKATSHGIGPLTDDDYQRAAENQAKKRQEYDANKSNMDIPVLEPVTEKINPRYSGEGRPSIYFTTAGEVIMSAAQFNTALTLRERIEEHASNRFIFHAQDALDAFDAAWKGLLPWEAKK